MAKIEVNLVNMEEILDFYLLKQQTIAVPIRQGTTHRMPFALTGTNQFAL
jgi:hypothetical protein